MPRGQSKHPDQPYVFAMDTVSVREPGSKYPTSVQKGTVWHAECPMVKAHPTLFAYDPPDLLPRGWSPPVEQATAAPGEERNTGR
jgi:hypothetical protein